MDTAARRGDNQGMSQAPPVQTVQIRTFADVVDAADALPAELQEELIAILRKRLSAARREEITASCEEGMRLYKAGLLKPSSVDEIMSEIES